MKFMGYRRPDGRVGIRNHVLILSTVTCANIVADKIARKFDEEVVSIVHPNGCGQGGEDHLQTRRVLLGTASHPNVGAVIIVGLGCETMDTRVLAEEVAATGKPTACLLIQEGGGTTTTTAKGVGIARDFLKAVEHEREPVDFSELVVATECGGSDAFSGITANPAVGAAADQVVGAGGTVILSEVTEMIGAEHIMARRARDEATARRLIDYIQKREREAAAAGVDLMGAQINPGNFEGGLTTPEEKSLGTIRKGGMSPLEEIFGYAHRPSRRGLVVMDTPGDDVESVVGMVAGGAQVVLFTTGRGSPTGNPIAPVIKIASNSPMYRRMEEDMDINAGTILEGLETIEETGARILEEVRAVADGKLTRAEILGHREFAVNIIGPRL